MRRGPVLRLLGQTVVGRPRPADGEGLDRAVQAGEGAEIFDPQCVVRGGEGRCGRTERFLQGRLPGGGEGETPVQKRGEDLRNVRCLQRLRHLSEGGHLPQLAAEGEVLHHAGGIQKGDRAEGEGLCRSRGPDRGQLQHQVHAPQQGQPGPGPLIGNGTIGLLDPVSAHHGHHRPVSAQQLLGLPELVGVAGMEGIILGDDPDSVHIWTSKEKILRFLKKAVVLSEKKS